MFYSHYTHPALYSAIVVLYDGVSRSSSECLSGVFLPRDLSASKKNRKFRFAVGIVSLLLCDGELRKGRRGRRRSRRADIGKVKSNLLQLIYQKHVTC